MTAPPLQIASSKEELLAAVTHARRLLEASGPAERGSARAATDDWTGGHRHRFDHQRQALLAQWRAADGALATLHGVVAALAR